MNAEDFSANTERLNRQQAVNIVQSCLQNGIDHFFIAPGSRCTPLTLAIANCSRANITQHFDERALAFCCMGYGRATGRPGVFVCTSGTAVANAFPAVIEASLEDVSMLLLTADRPPELHGIGANQTIDQQNLFGNYPRSFINVSCPGDDRNTGSISRIMSDAIEQAMFGPVHVNCMIREPFGEIGELPDAEMDLPAVSNSTAKSTDLQPIVLPGGNSMVVLGSCRPDEASEVLHFAQSINSPLLADVSTGIRSLSYDLGLLQDNMPTPKNVYHFGRRFVSKRLMQFLKDAPIENYWQIGLHRHNIDPCRKVTRRIEIPISSFCSKFNPSSRSSQTFFSTWTDRCESADRIANAIMSESTRISEPLVARNICELIPDQSGLFLGNSMPVRDMDMFGKWPIEKAICVGANRGASGIDGLLASTIGFADGLGKPTTLVIGDLSLLHDLNSLALLKNASQLVVSVVINNNGGGIFHLLPVAEKTTHFEQFFGTPHDLRFDLVAKQFSIPYVCCESVDRFRIDYAKMAIGNNCGIIEVLTDRSENGALRRRIAKAIRSVK